MCRCVSIMPGITMPLLASMVLTPSGVCRLGPTASILPSMTRTSASCSTSWAAFMVSTVPPRSTIGSLMFAALLSLFRNDYQLGSAFGRFLAFPRGGDVSQRDALHVDLDLAAGDVLGERLVRVALDLVRRVRDREARHVQRDAADGGSGERDLGAGQLADLHVSRMP